MQQRQQQKNVLGRVIYFLLGIGCIVIASVGIYLLHPSSATSFVYDGTVHGDFVPFLLALGVFGLGIYFLAKAFPGDSRYSSR